MLVLETVFISDSEHNIQSFHPRRSTSSNQWFDYRLIEKLSKCTCGLATENRRYGHPWHRVAILSGHRSLQVMSQVDANKKSVLVLVFWGEKDPKINHSKRVLHRPKAYERSIVTVYHYPGIVSCSYTTMIGGRSKYVNYIALTAHPVRDSKRL